MKKRGKLLLATAILAAVWTTSPLAAKNDNDLIQFRSADHVLGFSKGGVLIASGTHALKIEFSGAAGVPPVGAHGENLAASKDAAPLTEVNYPELWPGVALRYQGQGGRVAKSTYQVSAGADPGSIRLKSNVPVRLDSSGLLHYGFSTGEMVESKPVAWQIVDGRRVDVVVRFAVHGDREIGFNVGPYRKDLPLTIDPVLTWLTFLGSNESYNDEGGWITTDTQGNVYVSGTSDGEWWPNPRRAYSGAGAEHNEFKDAFVAKLDSNGTILWVTFLGGRKNDIGGCLRMDAAGNIYVVGSSGATWGSPVQAFAGGESDAFAAKLRPDGTLEWNTFLGTIPNQAGLYTGSEEGFGLSLDDDGNLYIAGTSGATWGTPVRPFGGYIDAFVAKLSPQGGLLWNTFLGGTDDDLANGIAVNGAGMSYVTGTSHASWGSPIRPYQEEGITWTGDAFVAALDSNGTLVWNTFLGGKDGMDRGFDIALDGAGNLYATGVSDLSWENPIRPIAGGGYDVYVAKLNPSGALIWNTFLGGIGHEKYFGGNGLAVDAAGGVYVNGTSLATWGNPVQPFFGEAVPFCAKLNTDGALIWNTFFMANSPGDTHESLAVDGSGRVYLTGSIAAKQRIGVNPIRPAHGGYEIYVVKLLADGGLLWDTFLGGYGDEWGESLAVDGLGNIFVAGMSGGTWGTPLRAYQGGKDAFIAKLSADGSLLWNAFLGGQGYDTGTGVAVDGAGNILVAGTSTETWGNPVRFYSAGRDAFVAKLNSNGSILWNTFLGGSGDDDSGGLGAGSGGNAVMAGTSANTWGSPVIGFSGLTDAFVAKINAEGQLLWNSFLGGADDDRGRAAVLDSSGFTYVIGSSEAGWGNPVRAFQGYPDGFVARLDQNGGLLWNTFLGGSYLDDCLGLAVDRGGNAFISGRSWAAWGNPINGYSGYDAFVAKLDANGNLQWNTFVGAPDVQDYDTGYAYEDVGNGLALDGSDNIYITGASTHFWGNPLFSFSGHAFVAAFNAQGVLLWNAFLGGDVGKGIAADGLGNVFLTGRSSSGWGTPVRAYQLHQDAFVAKIGGNFSDISLTSPNGGENWTAGSTHLITWNGYTSAVSAKLEYSTDGGTAWTTIIASTPNTGSYSWTLPAVASANCFVRIGDAATGYPWDTSDAAFTISISTPIIGFSKTALNFGTERNGTPTPAQTVTVSNLGTGTLNWTAAASADWISVTPAAGTGAGVLTIGIARTDLTAGDYSGSVTVTDAAASNSPATIAVSLHVTEAGADAAPFGDFSLPADGATVVSSIPVTGWALDDIGIESVKIYRGTGLSDRVFIGDATLVKGARPDVEAAYPAYPQNDKAGWGYMLLTNMLPGGGNGPFQLLAYATDTTGHEILLGSKSITCNNAAATLPFGAIDTPVQGGTASGSAFSNFGWALTPQPKSIPIDGSTITVWVDGLPKGHPVYNNYRADVATLFPGYANSNGAVGYFYLNTTGYADGVHTIAWSVSDSAGATDGIGSRYFTIQNAAGGAPALDEGTSSSVGRPSTGVRPASDLDRIPEEGRIPVYVKKGWGDPAEGAFEFVAPGSDGRIRFVIPEVTPIILSLEEPGMEVPERTAGKRTMRTRERTTENHVSAAAEAYELVRDELRPLPVGATFDPESGIFSWLPGPGFIGEYTIVFVKNGSTGKVKKTVTIAVGTGEKRPG